ncbi:hypothetical protein MHLP_02980 [Candidatus Mycoplasma haematolamae str. Purdue]|uniref:Uncharacterized protein n=1 Tax=Mycoplasma haematolamae (strain Purdue) TaxID=1212765 RepID=I7CG18_MYCHA|nr:hypothetical protein [Candidatus Mycoplasma haematolamae]AFO52176.1 hypothetical protein MHLP_02980 [Candidatus Mycoplasma haematolamae str. Purdue]
MAFSKIAVIFGALGGVSAAGAGGFFATGGGQLSLETRTRLHEKPHSDHVVNCKSDVCDHIFNCYQASDNAKLHCGHVCLADRNLYADYVLEEEKHLVTLADTSKWKIHKDTCPSDPDEHDYKEVNYQSEKSFEKCKH